MHKPKNLDELAYQNRNGNAVSWPSICSANQDVIAASMLLAKSLDQPIIIEATSNQVNQLGGYTGMTPNDFRIFVENLAKNITYPIDQIILGGDHLGPQVWKNHPAEIALEHAKNMMRAYVEAGFTKVHLDCSEGCAGEPAQVGDHASSARAAILAQICERYAPDPTKIRYVVGTEVPPPGGEQLAHDSIAPTSLPDAKETIRAQKQAFISAGLPEVWDRVIGLVVQPGIEFGANEIHHFPKDTSDDLSSALKSEPNIVFEAHSTDYQEPWVFTEIAKRHFAIQKVGPALTFAYREAIYSLSSIDAWLNGSTHISEFMERLMLDDPSSWKSHYARKASEQKILRHFSYADRIRYYWPKAQQHVIALETRVNENKPVEPMLMQYFDQSILNRAEALRAQGFSFSKSLICAKIQHRLYDYYQGS